MSRSPAEVIARAVHDNDGALAPPYWDDCYPEMKAWYLDMGGKTLAALRADGWELYRPEECVEFTVEHGGSYPDPYSGEEREAEPVMRSSQSEPARCYLNYGTYRLVPVESEDRL